MSTDFTGREIVTTTDADGNTTTVFSQTDSLGNVLEISYDHTGAILLTETSSDGSVKTAAYSDDGSDLSATDVEAAREAYQAVLDSTTYDSDGNRLRTLSDGT